MAKFGVFAIRGGSSPLQSFEGDYMTQAKEFVEIHAFGKDGKSEQVAAIHLEPGFSVKKIGD